MMGNARTVTLDVREDIRRGQEPFGKIMQTVAGLGPDQKLVLLVPFEPAPLYGVLQNKGFEHSSRQIESGDWEITFSRGTHAEPAVASENEHNGSGSTSAAAGAEVDTRGLEPPEPLVKIIEALATLPDGEVLRALTDRRPMHLYAQLEQRGFVGESQEQSDGSFVTLIRRA